MFNWDMYIRKMKQEKKEKIKIIWKLRFSDVTNGQKSENKLQATVEREGKRKEFMWVDIFICKYLTLYEWVK